jgi:hypothetical protein
VSGVVLPVQYVAEVAAIVAARRRGELEPSDANRLLLETYARFFGLPVGRRVDRRSWSVA